MKVEKGFMVDTSRNKGIKVLEDPDQYGWITGMTLGGREIYFNGADVVKVYTETTFIRSES